MTLESTPPLMATSTRLRVMGLLGVRMVGMSAVSYTHLDVYKRQGRGSRAGVALPIVAPPAVWLGGCAAFAMDPEFGNVVLGVPAVVFALVAVGAASLFVVQILQGLRVAPYDARPGSSPA